jgi:hypothetical protein
MQHKNGNVRITNFQEGQFKPTGNWMSTSRFYNDISALKMQSDIDRGAKIATAIVGIPRRF